MRPCDEIRPIDQPRSNHAKRFETAKCDCKDIVRCRKPRQRADICITLSDSFRESPEIVVGAALRLLVWRIPSNRSEDAMAKKKKAKKAKKKKK